MTAGNAIPPGFVPTPSASVQLVDLGFEAVLVKDGSSDIQLLDSAAAEVWSLLDGKLSVDQIVTSLSTSFGVDCSRIHSDVVNTIHSFDQAGILGGVANAAESDMSTVSTQIMNEPVLAGSTVLPEPPHP